MVEVTIETLPNSGRSQQDQIADQPHQDSSEADGDCLGGGESHAGEFRPVACGLTKGGRLIEGIFRGATINTPSMLCVADYLDTLDWIRSIGGLRGAIRRADANLAVIEAFVAAHDWIHFLAREPSQRSSTSVCLTVDLADEQVRAMTGLLAEEGVAFDIGAYRDAPAGLRIWCGATVEEADVSKLMPWLEWAYTQVKGE